HTARPGPVGIARGRRGGGMVEHGGCLGADGSKPVEMLQQMNAVAEQVEIPKGEPGPVTWLIGLGLSAGEAVKAAMAAFLIPSAAAMWALRRRPVEVLYAVAAHRPTTGKALPEALPKSRRVG